MRTASLILTLSVLAAGPAHGDTLKLKSGARLQGEATAYDEGTRKLSFRTEAGDAREIDVDDLDGRSFYQVVRSQVPRDSAQGQLQLANFARDVGLYAHAVRHYGYATDADPGLTAEVEKEMGTLRREAGEWAMGLAREAIAEGDEATAEKWLTKIVTKVPDEPVAREAAAMLDEYHARVQSAKDDELEREHAAALAEDLEPAKRYYDRMLEKDRSALTGGSSSRAVKTWEAALKDGERARRELDKFAKKHDEPDMREAVAGYRTLVDEHLIRIHLNLASHWTTRSSYNKAQSEVNQALAIDPENRAAQSARARIESASSRGWGWGGRALVLRR